MHYKGVVHRDIKPENLIVENEHDLLIPIKLIDFGTAVKFNPGDFFTRRVGSLKYMAPAILLGLPYREKCDLWSIGVMSYFLLCEEFPFDLDNPKDLQKRLKNFLLNSRYAKSEDKIFQTE